MRPFLPRLQGMKYRFTKYFDVVGAEMAAFVCFSSVFASFVKQHRLTIFWHHTPRLRHATKHEKDADVFKYRHGQESHRSTHAERAGFWKQEL